MTQKLGNEKAVEDEINREFENADTQVYTYEAEASPEEKAKQTLKDSEGTKTDNDPNQKTGEKNLTHLPGSIPSVVESAFEMPDWARTGWQRVSNLGSTETDKDIFDEILGDMYFGNLWLNSAVVFVSIFLTYIITSIGGGIGWVIIISAFVGTYFKNSVRRFYRNARSEIGRELAKEKLELYEEPAEWINEFLRRFWLIYEPILSATIVKTADSILASSTPSFLDSIRLTTFTLGSKPVVIESIRSYPKSEDDVVVMDWRVSFIPNDLVNMTRAQLSRKVNPKIVLTIRMGKGMVGAGIPILLEDMSFSGLIRAKLKLINTFPHVKTIDISFLEEPTFDYVLKPIGGETFGFDIANLPGLSSFIRDQVHANLRPMMYAPNVYTIDAELLAGGYPIETAIGILKLTIFNAKGLRNAERFGTSDPYVKISFHGNKELAKTKVIEDSLNPVWNETHFLILTSLNEFLRFELWDSNGLSKDKPLGTSTFELNTLLTNPNQENITIPVSYEGKPHGEIRFDANWYSIAEGKEGEPAPKSNIGVLRFNIHQAKDLGRRNLYAELLLNGKVVFKTKVLKKKNNPVWEESFEVFVTNRADAKLAVNIRDDRDLANDPTIAKWETSLDQFLTDSNEKKIDWFNVAQAPSGKLRLTGLWKPVLIDHIPGPSGYAESCGFVRLHIKNAKELKNFGQMGKSDPYTKILLDTAYRGRTVTISDNLNPIWNEIFYIPVHNTRETLFLQVWDREVNVKDKKLGFAELEISKLIVKREDETIEAAESIDTSSPLTLDKESKGFIDYSAAFYPTVKEKKIIPTDKNEVTEEKEPGNINVLDYQTGILVIYINRANLEKKETSIDVYVDNGLYPVYTTKRCKTANPEYNEVTDVVVKELDFSKIFFKIKQGNNKDPFGIVEADARYLLERSLESSQEVGVDVPISGINNATLNVYIRYIPVKYTVQPSESINNMGVIQISIKNAENLPGADRSGTSDPFIVFTLNNEKVYKTKTIKKTCDPEFNEDFNVTVHSRIADVLEFEIFDWNQLGSDKKIASGKVQLDDLPTFERAVKKIQLNNMLNSSEPGGVLNLHIVFRPEFTMRKKQGSGITRTLTEIGTGISTGVGNVVSTGGSFVGSGINQAGNIVGSGKSFVGSGFGLLKKNNGDK